MSETSRVETQRLPRALEPLATPVYRRIWMAALASNVGSWMQSVAAAWLMAGMSGSPLLVGLVQTAQSLPIFLLAVPAGAFADMVDRRRLLITTQSGMLAAAALLGVSTLAGWTGPATLLLLTFTLGAASAVNAPAWQATVPLLVPRPQLPAAVALNSVQFNIARAIGPALGGIAIAIWNPGVAFVINAISFLGVVMVLWRWEGDRRVPRRDQKLIEAIATGARFIRDSARMRSVLVRNGAFVSCASALWAMLPVVAKMELGSSSRGYGVLLGCLGAGSVIGAVFFARLRGTVRPDRIVAAGSLLFASAIFGLAYLEHFGVLVVAMLSGGVAWMIVMSTFNVSAQIILPAWVRARALSFYILVFQGTMALGGWMWGATASRVGPRTALYVAAAALLTTIALPLRFPLERIHEPELTPDMHWPEPAQTSTTPTQYPR